MALLFSKFRTFNVVICCLSNVGNTELYLFAFAFYCCCTLKSTPNSPIVCAGPCNANTLTHGSRCQHTQPPAGAAAAGRTPSPTSAPLPSSQSPYRASSTLSWPPCCRPSAALAPPPITCTPSAPLSSCTTSSPTSGR